MRKHSVRKWIHAICDLLPLLVIPIFALAVRSDNNFQPIEVTYGGGYDVVDTYQTNDVQSGNDLIVGNLYKFSFDDTLIRSPDDYFTFYIVGTTDLNPYSVTYSGITVSDYYNNSQNYIQVGVYDDYIYLELTNNNAKTYLTCTTLYLDETYIYFLTQNDLDNFKTYFEANFDTDYPSWFSASDYMPKTVTYIDGVVYNDNDVGSQMMYTLYQTTDKYFNFNNVGVFQDLYNWFETNMFHGTAPMSFYIVWNVILFEFIMDLIFLTYMVFMFIIDFTECMIDRFFEKSYRGGR